MSMDWVRKTYNVPAMRGGRVIVDGRKGTITSADNCLRVRFDGEKFSQRCHPTWRVEYLGLESDECALQSATNSSQI